MNLFADELDLDRLIRFQRSAIMYRIYFAIAIAAVGIVVIAIGFLLKGEFAREEGVNTIIKIAGVFVSSLSGFPLGKIITRKEKIEKIEIARNKLRQLKKADNRYDPEERRRKEEEISNFIEKLILG